MLSRKVQKIHNSKAVVIPAHICDMLGIVDGDYVQFRTDRKQIVITPISPARQDPQETGAATIPQGECAHDIF